MRIVNELPVRVGVGPSCGVGVCPVRFPGPTRTQRIRTAAEIGVEATIVETVTSPVYQWVATKAQQLRDLGMSDKAIAQALGVSDKTVTKAIVSLDPTR